MQKADRFRTELLRRGVLLVPVVWGERKTPDVEKKGFGSSSKAATSLPSIGVTKRFCLGTKKIIYSPSFSLCKTVIFLYLIGRLRYTGSIGSSPIEAEK